MLSTMGLILLILNTSYFLGLFWFILCEIQEDIATDENKEIDHSAASS